MSAPEIPAVSYLALIQADNAGKGEDVLRYDSLTETVAENARYRQQRDAAFWDAETDSVNELSKARQLGFEYFVATADKVVGSRPHNRDVWADRYTNACMELFGEVSPITAARLAGRQLRDFRAMRFKSNVDQAALANVLSVYELAAGSHAALFDIETERRELDERKIAHDVIESVLQARYGSVLELITSSDTATLDQPQLVELFEAALQELAGQDSDWEYWNVKTPDKGTGLMVNGKKQQVIIPKGRIPATASEALKLLKHELLCHGLRAVNGRRSGDKKLLSGYPNYLAAEEGLGVIAGSAEDGEVEDIIFDRYIDIALAAGQTSSIPLKRHELANMVYDRHMIRRQAKAEPIDSDALWAKTRKYVDRIYRGSPGDDIGIRQAVYTADTHYYAGYAKMNRYITEKVTQGHSPGKIFDYLMQGKFDPTDNMHVAAVGELI